MGGPAYTHRCSRGFGGMMTSTATCDKRLRELASPTRRARLTIAARLSLEKCRGCPGPELLPEPIPVEVAGPAAETREGAMPKEPEKHDAPCKCGRPRGRNDKGRLKPMCDICQAERIKKTHTPEAQAKAAASRKQKSEANREALREQARAEIRSEIARDAVAQARAERDAVVELLGEPAADEPAIRAAVLNFIAALDAAAQAGGMPGWLK